MASLTWWHDRITGIRREVDGRYIVTFNEILGELWVESPDYELREGERVSRWGDQSMTLCLIVGERIIYDARPEYRNFMAGKGWRPD